LFLGLLQKLCAVLDDRDILVIEQIHEKEVNFCGLYCHLDIFLNLLKVLIHNVLVVSSFISDEFRYAVFVEQKIVLALIVFAGLFDELFIV
jgi:hypothetical protein